VRPSVRINGHRVKLLTRLTVVGEVMSGVLRG